MPHFILRGSKQLKRGSFIIDTAADAGNTIEGNHFTTMKDSIYKEKGIYYYCVPNTPSMAYRNVSPMLSKQLSKYILKKMLKSLKKH